MDSSSYPQLIDLINLTYRDKVESIVAAKVKDNGDIVAVALDGRKRLAVKITDSDISIKLIGESAAFAKAPARAPKKKACKPENISCGFTCISGKKICRIGMTLEQQKAAKELKKAARKAKTEPEKPTSGGSLSDLVDELEVVIHETMPLMEELSAAKKASMLADAAGGPEADKRYEAAVKLANEAGDRISKKVAIFNERLREGMTEAEAIAKIKASGVVVPRKRMAALADLVRVTGFVPPTLKKITDSNRKRAYASRNSGLVALSRNNGNDVLWHEVGHHYEYASVTGYKDASEWRDAKATGKAQSLRRMTGRGYDPKEVAVPDKFVDPYVGKVYGWDSTEVVSMGFEHFSTENKLVELIYRDPSHAKFMIEKVLKK